MFLALILKELVLIDYELYMKTVNQDENLFNSRRYIEILFYFIFFFWQPSPVFNNLSFEEKNLDNSSGKTIYSVNAMFTAILLLRGFFIIRPILYISIFNDHDTTYCCRQFNFNSSLVFTLKSLSAYASLQLFTLSFILVILLLSYAVRIFERPANDNFDNYFNSFWFTIVTMTTVGFEEFAAKTSGGRIVSMIACLSGVFFVSMVIVSITNTLMLESHEYTVIAIMKKTENTEKKERIAGEIIAKYIDLIITRCNGHN